MQEYRICDCHCHVYPENISWRAVHAIDRFYGGLPSDPVDGTTKVLRESGEKYGISHFIIFTVATRPDQVIHINRYLICQEQASRGTMTAMGTLHPDAPDVRQDLEDLVQLGLKGVKLHPDIQGFEVDSPKAMRIFEMCEDLGLPVCVHTGDYRYDYSNPDRTKRVLRAFPRLKMIGAHFGGWSVWDEACRVLSDYPNLTVDTSSSFHWLTKEKAAEIIRKFGAGRVMFGTDYPIWNQKTEIDYLLSLGLEEEEYQDIFWNTCSRMFRFDA